MLGHHLSRHDVSCRGAVLCDFVPAIGFGVGFRLRNRFFSLSGNDVRKIRRHDTPVCRRMLNLLGKADLLAGYDSGSQ